MIRGWQINNAIIHQRKVGTNQLWTKVLSFPLQLKKRGGGKKQNPRVLEFLFKELPSKRYDADVIQGCVCILDTKVYFFIWWYLLRPLHWYLWQSWWLLFYHLPIQLQHKLEHLEFFLAKNITIIVQLLSLCNFFKKSQSRSTALRTCHIWDQSSLLAQTRICLKKIAPYLWFTYFAIPEEKQTVGWGHTFLKTPYRKLLKAKLITSTVKASFFLRYIQPQ